ncbi:MAG: cation transporting ATPase C-terminal domain-containing protein, partial [Chrysiogenetes bacterium]|nr:cation transporting ATPase C-terminal domain-containing protein [Chrysiogenetes bacterium]
PAMRAANVSVAMGRRGTDVARETAELILTDDNFASIVGGVEEGRIAYSNIRKVIYLLIATGGAEIVLFVLSMIAGLPPPLFAVQLLWLNLVTNGIQDVALAFEPGEGDELRIAPRPPREPIFNKVMIERCLLSAVIVGGVSFGHFQWFVRQGWDIDSARNSVLLLLVLFENIMVGNARSELRSGLTQNPWRNPLLLGGTVLAQLIHIGAAFVPGLNDILHLEPVSLIHWAELLGWALTVFAGMEFYKWLRRRGLRPSSS